MIPNPSSHEPSTTAALYAAGALTAEEAAAFEARLAGDPDCLVEFRKLEPALAALFSAVELPPPARVRDALLSRISADILAGEVHSGEAVPPLPPGYFVQRRDEGVWTDLSPGVRKRLLFRDPVRQTQSFLVRMDAGATFAEHPHPSDEECYVIEGDLHTLGRVLRAGDYLRAPSGSTHDVTRTENGCLLLITSALAEAT
jgi:quercetin dioxygenase-like cupin family protein